MNKINLDRIYNTIDRRYVYCRYPDRCVKKESCKRNSEDAFLTDRTLIWYVGGSDECKMFEKK